MSEAQAATESPKESTAQVKKAPPAPGVDKSKYSKRTLRAKARRKRKEVIRTDKEFAKSYFESKSKRSSEKKVAFRKRHSTKK